MTHRMFKADEYTNSDSEIEVDEERPLMVENRVDNIESSTEDRPRIRTPSPFGGSFESRPYGRFVVSSFDELPARLRNPATNEIASNPEGTGEEQSEEQPPTNSCSAFLRCLLACILDYKIIVLFEFLLLALPISAGFMGAKNMENCPMNHKVSIMLMAFGGLFTISLLCHIGLNIYRKCLNEVGNMNCGENVVLIIDVAVAGLFFFEMYTFFKQPPNADPAADNFCDETFYFYTFWMNCGTAVLFVLLVIFQISRCLRNRTTAT